MDKTIAHGEISMREGFTVISRMYYRPAKNTHSVCLTFEKDTDLFRDEFSNDKKLFFYRGMDSNDKKTDPKKCDQSLFKKTGSESVNSKFKNAVERYKNGTSDAEIVHLYKKLGLNKWEYLGEFKLIDYKFGKFPKENRKIFIFTLQSS